MGQQEFKSFAEFWPFYLQEHRQKRTRQIHFVGTTLTITAFFLIIACGNFWYLFILPVIGYGPAWYSHFFIEKNKPATFKYPLYSLIADFKLWYEIVRGKL